MTTYEYWQLIEVCEIIQESLSGERQHAPEDPSYQLGFQIEGQDDARTDRQAEG
jgi:hypothetical protein